MARLFVPSFTTLAAALLLLAATGGSFVGAAAGTFISFTPAEFTVKDNEPAKVGIKLLANPGAVKPVVFLEADGVLFSTCRLEFDGQNWDKPQEVLLYPKAAFFDKKETQVSIFGARLAWVGNESHNMVQSLTFKREVEAGKICEANGDPHYVTFDDRHFDFYKKCTAKAYYLLKTDRLVVQTQHGPWDNNNDNAVNSAVAIAYGKAVFIVDGRKGAAKKYSQLSPTTDGVEVVENKNGHDYQFKCPDGAQVKLNMNGNGKYGQYINVKVVVPGRYLGQTAGLCGLYDRNKENDFTKPDKSTTNDAMAFGESWAIPDGENIFAKTMGASILNGLQGNPPTKNCALPPPNEFNAAGVAPVAVGYDVPPVAQAEYAVPPPVVVQAQPVDPSRGDQPFADYVSKLCNEIVKVPGLEKVPQLPANLVQSNVDDCVKDCKLGGVVEPVDSYRIAVMRAAHTVASNAMAKFKICEATGKPRPRTAQEVEKFALEAGFGTFKCSGTNGAFGADNAYAVDNAAAACSGHGQCLTFGCQCNPDWAGKDCNVDMKAKAAGIPPRPAGVAAVHYV